MASPRNNSVPRAGRPDCIVSACLAGIDCTWRCSHKLKPSVRALVLSGKAVPVCPEILGGLSTPRENAEIAGKGGEEVLLGKARVVSVTGRDLSAHYTRGAQAALEIARRFGIRKAILKSNSPACGYGRIYDGSFGKTLKPGNGVFAALLLKHNFTIRTEHTA